MKRCSLLDQVEDYVAYRRGLGFGLEGQHQMLLDFVRHTESVGHQGPMTTELAVQWALSSSSTDRSYAAQRLSAVRHFARHLALSDPETEIPPVGLLEGSASRKPPHIYSDTEIAALLHEASLLHPHGGLCPRTYVTCFSLLAATGLRVSEACGLASHDVDLAQGLITVRESKFRKSRLVPLHSTTTEALTQYQTDCGPSLRGSFFRTDRAGTLKTKAVQATFRRLRDQLGWTQDGRTRRPRIHDLRHTFAVRCLLRFYEEGADIDRKILALATYLGHVKVSYTYWYFSAVPELMAISSQRFEHYARTVQEDSP